MRPAYTPMYELVFRLPPAREAAVQAGVLLPGGFGLTDAERDDTARHIVRTGLQEDRRDQARQALEEVMAGSFAFPESRIVKMIESNPKMYGWMTRYIGKFFDSKYIAEE